MGKNCVALIVFMFFICMTVMPAMAENKAWQIKKWEEDFGYDGSIDDVNSYTYVYDSNDRLKQEIVITNGINDEIVSTTYTYDASGNKVMEYIEDDEGLSDDDIEYIWIYTYAYDSNRNMISKEKKSGSYSGAYIYTYVERFTYVYDANNRKISEKEEIDRDNDGAFDSVTKTSFTYDENGRKTSAREESDDDNNGTIDSVSTFYYTYNADGTLSSEVESYDTDLDGKEDGRIDTSWVYSSGVLGDNIYKIIYFIDDKGNITGMHRYDDTYDANGNRIIEKLMYDSNYDGVYEVSYSLRMTYDANGNEVSILFDDNDDGTTDDADYKTWQQAEPNDVDNDDDGYKENQGDCDDTDAAINPGAAEICGDGIDQDCDGNDADCAADPLDTDDDGDGFSENQGDCDDADTTIYPGAVDTCGDGIDQDCDGMDANCGADPLEIDDDGDGYSENQGDCDDTNSSIAPNGIEICGDGIDQDCNGSDLACAGGISPPTQVTASDNTVSEKVQVTWNPAAGISTYDVFRADMPAWTGTAPKRIAKAVTGTSYDDTTALENRRYYYWAKSRNGSSTSKYSHFDTGFWGTSGSAPSKPTGVQATDDDYTAGEVRVTWNTTADTLVYEIFRAEIPAYLGGKIKKIGTSDRNMYDDTTAIAGTRYYYWVKARDSWGVSRYSVFDTGYTGMSSYPPVAPSNVIASDNTVEAKVSISWDASNRAVVYEIWRATDLVADGGTPIRVGHVTGTAFEDTTAIIETVYYYWIKARDCWGASKYSTPDTGHHSAGKG